MSKHTDMATGFYDACESGKGWEGCKSFCTPDASFSCQSASMAQVTTVEQYTDWMKGLMTVMPDAGYTLKGLGEDTDRGCVLAFGVFTGTHTGAGGPIEPTGKATKTEYVFVMQIEDGAIKHITKIWNDGFALSQLGWA